MLSHQRQDGQALWVLPRPRLATVVVAGLAAHRPSLAPEKAGLRMFWRRSTKRARFAVAAICLTMGAVAGLPAAAPAAQNVYATDAGSNTVWQYAVGSTGGLSPLTPATVPAGPAPWAIVVSPDDKSAYVANLGGGVSQYDIAPGTGALTPKTPATVPTGDGLLAIAVTPDGRSVYVKNENESTVSQYGVDPSTGALSPKSPAAVAGPGGTGGMAVSPDGRSVYAVGGSSTSCCTVWQYDISPTTGALSPKSPANFTSCCSEPLDVTVTPDSKSAYVTGFTFVSFPPTGHVGQYNVDPATGTLSPKNPAEFDVGEGPFAIVVTPNGRSAYVTDFEVPGPGFVWQYDIDPATGVLSPKAPPSVQAPQPINIAVSADGAHAYVVNALGTNVLSQFNVDPTTGALSPQNPPTVDTGSDDQGIAVTPLPRVPTNKDQCKNGGWRNFPGFKSQGQCVSFVATGGKNPPGSGE
jgi:6-phosphogluconolactonase (cycloisomerase 2 family)